MLFRSTRADEVYNYIMCEHTTAAIRLMKSESSLRAALKAISSTLRQAAKLREYLLRGGFLMVDDFHGTLQWASFMESMQRVFPDRPVVEISDQHEVFHVLYDLNQRIQIPGIAALMRGTTYEQDGVQPHWRGIYDDTGRLMVAIN